MNEDEIKILSDFALEFEPVHKEIQKTGGCHVHEYSSLWHTYKDAVRPVLTRHGLVDQN